MTPFHLVGGAWILTFIAGCLVLAASGFVGLHEILSGPDRPNYPTASRHLRIAMFVWCAALFYRGAEILSGLCQPHPVLLTYGAFQAAVLLAVVHGLLLEQQLRQWLPARLHARIRRLIAVASCRDGQAPRAGRRDADAEGLAP